MIFLNNFIARSAPVVESNELTVAEASELRSAGDVASGYLLSVLPGNADILDSIADFKSVIGDFPSAIALINKSISLVPGQPAFYVTYAKILLRSGQFEEAMAEVQKASRLLRAIGSDARELLTAIDRLVEEIESEITRAP